MESVRTVQSANAATIAGTASDAQADMDEMTDPIVASKFIRQGAWEVEAHWAEVLPGPNAPAWSRLYGDARAQKVKHNPKRTVWRIGLGERVVYVKEFHERSIGERLAQIIRGSRAAVEFRRSIAAIQRGIPCVRHVGWASFGRRSLLVSEAIPDAESLADVWIRAVATTNPSVRRRRIKGIIACLANLLAKSHARGFVHGDEHPTNFLVQVYADDTCRAFYGDLQTSRVTARLGDAAKVRSLAQLHQWFRLRSSRSQRWRFLRNYSRNTTGDDRQAKACARRLTVPIMAETRRQAEALWSKRDRRITSTNTYFASIRPERDVKATVTLRYRSRDLYPSPSQSDRTLSDWKDLFPQNRPPGHYDRSWEWPSVETKFVQTERIYGHRSIVAKLGGGSRLRCAFVLGHRLRNRDLPCRWPIQLVEQSLGWFGYESRLWRDDQPRTVDWISFLSGDSAAKTRHRVCAQAGRLLRRMLETGAVPLRPTETMFGVDPLRETIIIDDPIGIRMRKRTTDSDRSVVFVEVYRLVLKHRCYRKSDAARFLRSGWPMTWKTVWRSLQRDLMDRSSK